MKTAPAVQQYACTPQQPYPQQQFVGQMQQPPSYNVVAGTAPYPSGAAGNTYPQLPQAEKCGGISNDGYVQ